MNHQEAIDYLYKADPILAQAIAEFGNCQLGWAAPQSNLLEVLAWAIISQQISTVAANRIYQRFLSLYPDQDSLDTEVVLQTPEEKLRNIGISRYKVRYLKNLAQHILTDLPTLADLEAMEDEAIIQILTQVKGIGAWTVQMLLIFRLHRLDILPSGDLGIRQAVKNLYQLEELP
ncbi:MAG: DNA-3-methyladenine glycosylase family protein, partial [Microcystaceae cyanobacterium]